MTRLMNVCFDWGSEDAEADRKISYAGDWTFNTSPVHGHSTYSISGGTGSDLRLGRGPYDGTEWAHVANRSYYVRWMVYFTADPAGDARFGYSNKSGSGGYVNFRMGDGTNQSFVQWWDGTDVLTWYTSTQTWPKNQWVRVEMRVYIGSSVGQCQVEVKVNGTTILNQSGITRMTSWATSGMEMQNLGVWYLGPNCYLASIAENDNQGSSQNSWPGAGAIVLLRPKADSQLGSWTGGGGGTSNIYEGVNNVPPTGTTTPSNTNMIRSVDTSGDNSTDEYRATLQSPSDVGLTSGEGLVLLQSTVLHGEEAATGTKTGSVGFISGPAEGAFTAFTAGEDYGEAGTWPTNWSVRKGGIIDITGQSYTVTPVIGLRKTDAGSAAINVCGLGAYLEYAPAPPAPDAPVLSSATPGNTTVDLAWTTPNTNGSTITGYEIWRAESSNNEVWVADVGVQNAWQDTGRTNGTQYFYKVLATSDSGDSALSNELSATPLLLGVSVYLIGSML